MSLASTKLTEIFGSPISSPLEFEKRNIITWVAPKDIAEAIPCLKKVYCNKALVTPLETVLRALIAKKLHTEIKTFDGCFIVRKVRGSEHEYSIHSWGMAIDLNAAENPMGGAVSFSNEFLQVWRDCLWTCGADFKRKDAMHFQYSYFK